MLRNLLGSRSFLAEAMAPVGRTLGGVTGSGLPDISIHVRWPWGNPLEDTQILEAAPKKRTSHQKKRQRQLAGNNQIKPRNNLVRCPACGHYKRQHTLCMHCVQEIRTLWKARDRQAEQANRDPSEVYSDSHLTQPDKELNYPERRTRPSEYKRKLADKESYVLGYPRSLPVKEKQPKTKQVPLVQRKPYSE